MNARQLVVVALVLALGVALGYYVRDRAPSPALAAEPKAGPSGNGAVRVAPAAAAPAVATAAVRPIVAPPPPEAAAVRGPIQVRLDAPVPAAQFLAQVRDLQADPGARHGAAAYELFYLLNQCYSLPAVVDASREACERRTQQCNPNHDENQRIVEACRSVPPELVARRLQLLDQAAAAGDVRAQLAFGRNPPEDLQGAENLWRNPEKVIDFKAKQSAYLEAAADRGAPEAFVQLTALRHGSGAEADKVAALAYYLAWSSNEVRGWGSPEGRAFYSQGLTPEQLRAAEAMREQLLARCCR